MHFQITRNGQTYGPYTLEDLQRYVSSGNILPTDLAKSESMTDWLTVAQVLAGQTGNAAFSQDYVNPNANAGFPAPGFNNPGTGAAGYAAPASAGSYGAPAAPTLNPNAYPDAPNLNWGLLLLFDLLTCSLFEYVWNLIIAAWARRVQPNATALWYYLGFTVLTILQLGLLIPVYHAMIHGINAGAGGVANPAAVGNTGPFSHPLSSLIGLVAWVVKLAARFIQRANLQEHFNTLENVGLQLNPVMVFFFGGLYFQYHLNKINTYKQQLRMSNPATH